MNRLAVVLGGASSVWDDLKRIEAARGDLEGVTVLAVNDAGYAYSGRIHHWVTLHPENLADWVERRRRAGRPMGFTTWGGMWRSGRHDGHLVDRVLPSVAVGSSGFHAVMVALHLGHARVLLCGVPLDPRPHFFDKRPWDSPMAHRKAWQDWYELLRGRVASMTPNGWTQELLGAPPESWLAGKKTA